MIYLDNSATTQPYPQVIESFQTVSTDFFANPSSIHQPGGMAETLLAKARDQAADLLNVKSQEIVFTSGGTEGNNLAIKGIAFKHQNRGKHIITSKVEHSSVYDSCRSLEELGFEVTYLPVNKDGVVSLIDLQESIREDTILISVMHVNNELGSIQPIGEIGAIAKKHPKLFFHVDYVQGLCKVPLDFKKNGVDLSTMSGHKIHGLKGTGVLYVNEGVSLSPLFHGGTQEGSYRAGTENLAGAVSFVKALRISLEKMEMNIDKLKELSAYLRQRLSTIEEITINTPENSAPHLVNISVPGLKPEVIIHSLGEKGVIISTKSACSSKQQEESRVLSSCGLPPEHAKAALRISMSFETTKDELNTFIDLLKKTIKQLKPIME